MHIVASCYIAPHEGGRGRLQAARAIPSFHGRPIFSDVAVAGVNSRTGDEETWYGRAIAFFKARHRLLEWDEDSQQQVWKPIEHDLVFLRWFRVTGWSDAVNCDIVQREPTPRKEASVAVEPIESLISVEMMLPKKSQTRGMELWYRNKYYRWCSIRTLVNFGSRSLQTERCTIPDCKHIYDETCHVQGFHPCCK